MAKLQQDVAEAREKLNVLVEEKHQYLMQQNSMLMNQQARSLPAHAFWECFEVCFLKCIPTPTVRNFSRWRRVPFEPSDVGYRTALHGC